MRRARTARRYSDIGDWFSLRACWVHVDLEAKNKFDSKVTSSCCNKCLPCLHGPQWWRFFKEVACLYCHFKAHWIDMKQWHDQSPQLMIFEMPLNSLSLYTTVQPVLSWRSVAFPFTTRYGATCSLVKKCGIFGGWTFRHLITEWRATSLLHSSI